MALLGWTVLASCQPGQLIIPPDSSDLTVKAAPGASGGSRNLAEEFLKHAPFPASGKTLMHEGLCYAEPYFQDRGLDPAGNDTDRYNGVDTATLFFSATRGTPETWLAMPNGRDPGKCPQSASETHVVESGKNAARQRPGHRRRPAVLLAVRLERLRPRAAAMPGGASDFGCPESFEGTQDTVLTRNVYERWGGIFSPGLRMACGFSTAAFCHPDDARRVWDLYDRSSNGFSPCGRLHRRVSPGDMRAPFPSVSPWEVPASSEQPFSTRGFSPHPTRPARRTTTRSTPSPSAPSPSPADPPRQAPLSGRPSSG